MTFREAADLVALADRLPEIPDDDRDFTPDLARKIIAKYQQLLRRTAARPGAVKPVDDSTPYPSIAAMKAAVELEVHNALGSVQTVVIGKLIQQAIDAALLEQPATPGYAAGFEACREALAECISVLELAERQKIKDPDYSAEIRALGDRIGYGALMSGAQAEWRARLSEDGDPVGGEFVAGPCHATVLSVLKRARAALSALPAPAGAAEEVTGEQLGSSGPVEL